MNFSTCFARQTCFALALCLVEFAQAQDLTNNQADASVARRLDWIRKGLTTAGEQKESSDIGTKREDIKRLISVTGTENLLKQSLAGMIPQMKQAMPQVPDEAWREVEKPASINELIDLYISIYEKHFTHEDIKGMLDFYDSPLGKKMVAKMPVVMNESMEAGNQWGIALAKRIEQNVSEKSPADISASVAKLTPTQKAWVVQQSGYDPEQYVLSDDGFIELRPVVKNLPQETNPSSQIATDDPQLGRRLLIKSGLNPDEWELTPVNGSYVGTIPKRKASATATPTSLPQDVRYIIRYSNASGRSTTYYSKDEPKPFGSGFKFKMFPTDAEFTLSGNIEIIKISTGAPKPK